MNDEYQPRQATNLQKLFREKVQSIQGDLAYRDELTGLYNYRLLKQFFEQWWNDIIATGPSLSLIMIDLDGFKAVNDTYGHLTGDIVLMSTAKILKQHFREDDLLLRYGGDEFVIVLPDVPASEAKNLALRARKALDAKKFTSKLDHSPVKLPVSFSMGIATWPEDGATGETLLQKADVELYNEKNIRSPKDMVVANNRVTRRQTFIRFLELIVLIASIIWITNSAVDFFSVPRTKPPVIEKITTPADNLWSERETQLLQEIEKLQEKLTKLTVENTEEMKKTDLEEQQITALQLEIEQLQRQLLEQKSNASISDELFTNDEMADEELPEILADDAESPITQREETPNAESEDDESADKSNSPTPEAIIVLPKLFRYSTPEYPEVAKKLRREASIRLEITVDVDGKVIAAEPEGEPLGFGFDEAAKEAAFRAQYAPGTINDIPSQMKTFLTIDFQL